MDLKDALKQMKEKEEPEVNTEPVILEVPKEEEPEETSTISFEQFKREIGNLILNDKILVQMKLTWFEDSNQMIVFQGVRSNVIARLRSNGQHVINRSTFKKRTQTVLDHDLEPNADQKAAIEKTKPKKMEINKDPYPQDQAEPHSSSDQ